MGQIIKPVCLCPGVRLRALSRSHFLMDFHQNWHSLRKNPKSKNEFVGGKHRTTSSLSLPPKPHFRRRGPQNTYKYQ